MKLRAVAIVALLCAGCSSEPAGKAAAPTVAQDKGVLFAQCMREHGSAGFPDPGGSDQAFAEGVERASKDASFDDALEACKDLRPAGVLGAARKPAEQDAALAFAECIRSNGVKDFPDPVDGEPLVDTRRIPSTGSGGGMSVLNAAMKTCAELGNKARGAQP